ncbi:hypothetical protein VMT65_12075 [Nocardia sp. CDC153]|uniref:hypothetical protein n=1 Tax=Nocardia sp. CDC153 TaxID=3112167 RepID=UPI002DBD5975|nr:hypothetical protein [Nocardia sp. CDC153]MEC3953769.1 hypothetical protein [Nocardia sp. CDC153]
MGIAALILWLLTATGGFVLLGTWIAKGGVRQPGSSRLPAPVLFGHFLLAAAGLIVWIVYLVIDNDALSWIAFALLVPVAALGFFMLARWLPVYRSRNAIAAATTTAPERHFPIAIVGGHGLLAVATVVLVFLTALGVGS